MLPPGQWSMSQVKEHFLNNKETIESLGNSFVDIARLDTINRLKPDTAIIGAKGWMGYVTFAFDGKRNVVLENPIKGNAAYILKGKDWKRLSKHSKGWLKNRSRSSYRKVVHKGKWIDRIEEALNTL